MNAVTALTRLVERRAVSRTAATTASAPARRERDFGVGYGRSSGYAAPRGYVERQSTGFFRCR